MIRVTADLFSGRPNPSWIMADANGEEILKQIAKEKQIISKPNAGYDGLGFRGIEIEVISDEKLRGIPNSFKIADGTAEDQKTSIGIASRIVEQMTRYSKLSLDSHRLTPIDKHIQKIILASIEQYQLDLERIGKVIKKRYPKLPKNSKRVTVDDASCCDCKYEESKFNPNFWNADSHVRRNNNCYNYGRNWKTNTFAQPGRFSGQTAGAMSCSEVKAASLRDGLKLRCDCLPQSEYPRRLMALVIAPGVDYHWYRKQDGGFWGHKPGGTPAKNTDNSGNLITDPETCDRGSGSTLNYTDFCDYFYAGKSVSII
ncbi:hypothetical protein SAMN05421766_104423 [Zobellia uliginosa]|uniref:Uncharacterized protein n=1 Tax=Zobellia uliginosa TaxID=143224 RepID=A0ABY1KWA2_9FLAO|nr:hypothetical protein [Zobellia uliginosa]SIS85813.1 hypothetical protein SAMN05421766_104423 [Zobellia uliginosa]